MEKITYKYVDGKVNEVEVNEDFAAFYAEIVRKDYNTNRKETRRHQSLDKSLEHGWDVWDKNTDVNLTAECNEVRLILQIAMKFITDKQRLVLVNHAVHKMSFREIGETLGVCKETVCDHYHSAIKKMKKLLKNTLSKDDFPGY